MDFLTFDWLLVVVVFFFFLHTGAPKPLTVFLMLIF